MSRDIIMEQQRVKDSIVVYAENIKELSQVLRELEQQGIEITFQNSEGCLMDLDSCILDTLNQTRPNLILIETDGNGNGITLYQMIRDEGTMENLPVFFIGPRDDSLSMEILELGALQYIEKPINKESLILKINNYIKVSKGYIKSTFYDYLTGIYTRKYGVNICKKVIEMARGQSQPYILLMMDIDNISSINRKLGKKKGDELLRESVEIFRKYLSPKEVIFRYSGERFVVLFPNIKSLTVLNIANKMQEQIGSLSSKYGMKIGFTGGIASNQGHDADFDSLIRMVFQAIAAGKQDGKGRTYIQTNGDKAGNKITLLLVDEDRVILNILVMRYRNKGYEVFSAQNSEQAIDIIKNQNVNVIITNFVVPGMTYYELIGAFHQENKQCKILVMLARRNEQDMNVVLKAGADDYIVKPFSPVELDLRIEKFLG